MAANPTTSPAEQPPLESPLPREVLTELYASMLKARLLARRRGTPSFAEALVAVALQNADKEDVIVAARPDPVLEVLRGAELSTIARPRLKNSDNDVDQSKVLVAGEDAAAGVAAGIALALKRKGSNSLVLAFMEGSRARGQSWEQATAFASHHRSPVVYVADWTGGRQSRAQKAGVEPWPFPHIAVDGRDVIAVYRVTKEAIAAARRGHGPTMVDGINFLAPGSRGRDERDPILPFRGYLKRHNAWSDKWNKRLEERLKDEVSAKPPKKKA